jgi:glycosyltransferase involved in cell wall biosynthesis
LNKKRRILISAYGCEPLKGSESGVGWNWILQLAKSNELHVVTRRNNKDSIEAHLPTNIASNVTFHYYDTNRLIRKIKKGDKRLYLYYFFWQLGAIRLFRQLIHKYAFDYSIHLSFGSFWMPTFLPFFNIPFIWGPLGGADVVPKSFLSLFPLKDRIIQQIRYVLNYTTSINPFILYPCKKAVAILCRTHNNADIIPKQYNHKVHTIIETAIDIADLPIKSNKTIDNKTIHCITTGRLVPFKNVITAVRAFSHIPSKYAIHYTIIGDGQEIKNIEAEIKNINLTDRISLLPLMPRKEVLEYLAKTDIYLFPSLREGGTWALMEAMAMSLPCICLNWTGMSIITDDESALRLSVTNPEQMSMDIADGICKLIDNPILRKKIGDAGQERIKNIFNWNAKEVFIDSLFAKLENNN